MSSSLSTLISKLIGNSGNFLKTSSNKGILDLTELFIVVFCSFDISPFVN